MGFWGHLREAIANIFSAKLRSILAILGILVGTGSVVALITSSQLATSHALAQFKTLGTHLIAVNISPAQNASGGSSGNNQANQGKLSLEDIPKIKAQSNQILQIAPYISNFQPIIYHGESAFGATVGATEDFASVAKVNIEKGRFVRLIDGSSLYCVIGSKLADKFHQQGMRDPIGQQIRIGNWFFTIIGVAKPWQPNLFVFIDIDNSAIIPLDASYLLSNYATINNLLIKLTEDSNVSAVQNVVQKKLNELLPNARIDIRNPEQILQLIGKQQATFTWLLGAIGGISLLVGGIGVMNIMLVSVVERRREIGVRLAIGAHQKDILIMFLIESVMLTLFGGILGIIIGLLVSYIIAIFSGWEFYLYFLPPLLGFFVSVLVGIISGFYPALRASRLDPIESLRAE